MKVSDKYKELVHYTNPLGLKGIIDSQSLWASHARFLNDAKEMEYFFETKCRLLVEEAIKIGINSNNLNIDTSKLKELAKALSEQMKEITLSITDAHIISLCGNSNDVVARDGLLSQWRAYGHGGGYAIVFESKLLEEFIENEFKSYRYHRCMVADVEYYESSLNNSTSDEEIKNSEDIISTTVINILLGESPESNEEGYDAATTLSCLYKHWGFHEENEVRIIAIPQHKKFHAESENLGDARPIKEVKSFLRNGCIVPYIELCALQSNFGNKLPLPVKRIIVGPHRDQKIRAASLRHLIENTGLNWEVGVSETPFIGT